MAAAPAVDGNDNDANGKARNVVVQSETMGRDNCENSVLHSVMPVSGDPMETFGSLGNMGADNVQFTEDEHGESTEWSSSFGASCSVSDDETKSDMNNMEVDSPFLGHINVDDNTFVPKMVRQKQVSAEWRKTVGPLMWRCHWLELRMKNLLSQVAKYDKELSLINHEKDLQLEMIKAGSSESELPKLDFQIHEGNTMKRIKRKRDEDNVDTMLYMKNHQILSHYYENKNSGAETDGLLINDGFNSLVVEDIKSSLGPDNALLKSKENDRVSEQYYLREIILAIDGMQSRVLRLQSRLSKIRSKHEKLTSDVDHTRVKVPQKSQKTRNHLPSYKKGGDPSLQKMKDLHSLLQKKDICRPLAEVTSALSDRSTDCVREYVKRDIVQEGATQPDANEITFEMLFGSDNPLTHAHVGELCKESADDVLIDNQAAQEEGYQQFEKVKQVAEKHSELVDKAAKTLPSKGEKTSVQVMKHEPVHETAPTVKHAYSGNKQGQKPKKKHGSSLPASKDQIEKSPDVPAKKKKTEKDPHNLKNEKPLLVAVNTRRSQRVRKPKIY